MRLVLALGAAACAGVARGAGPADSAGASRLWFLQDGRLVAVERGAPTVADTVRALLAGPTAPSARAA